MTKPKLADRDSLYRVLRVSRPKGVVVVDVEGERREIGLRNGKSKWDHAVAAILSMVDEVDRVELLDEKDKLRQVWKPADSPTRRKPDAEDEDEDDDDDPGALAVAARLAKVITKATDVALARHSEGFKEILEGQRETREALSAALREVSASNRELMKQQTSMLRATYSATLVAAQAHATGTGKGEDGENEGLMQQLVALVAMKMDPKIRGLMNEGAKEAAEPEDAEIEEAEEPAGNGSAGRHDA